jgi:hypothetical protein
MANSNPMDRFITSYGIATKKMEQITNAMDPLNPRDWLEYTKAKAELKMRSDAASSAVSSRHSLLKKIIGEIH